MASNILSRLLPSASDGQPEDGERNSHDIPPSDASASDGDHLGTAIDEENLGEHFQDQDLEQLLDDAAHSEIATESTAFLPDDKTGTATRSSARGSRPKWMSKQPPRPSEMDEDDDVPESLLLEPGTQSGKSGKERSRRKSRGAPMEELPPPVPGPANRNTRAQWRATRARQRLHDEEDGEAPAPPRAPRNPLLITDPKDRAMWKWANVQNLDQFLDEVYRYFEEKGIWSIVLRKTLNLITVAFVVGFTTFLTMCISYKNIHNSSKLSEIVEPKCMKKIPGLYNFFLWLFAVMWIFNFIQFLIDIPRLWEMHNFFHHLLGIPDADIQTVSWQTVVGKLMALRDANAATAQNLTAVNRRFISGQSKQRMDAHDIANRLMRKDNYLIALVNKDYFDTTVPIPFLGTQQFWTRSIEWNIGLCLMDFVFDEEGHIRPEFLTTTNRKRLIDTLRRRFAMAGIINIFFAPFLFVYYCIAYFFQYFAEYHRNPSELGSRTFTPLAEWKFREFNELWHLFLRRKNMAYPYATRYLEQFPKDKTAQLCRFASFIAGALAAVLGLASLLAPELFLGFEILPGQTVLFWLGILGGIYAAARAQIPEEELVLDPEYTLINVIECTRYCPASWEGRLHSDEVRRDFSTLYKQKIVVFLEEALSMIFTPYVLLISLPRCADGLIDFFREFTMHVDGLGHVCSFAVFDFTRPGKNAATQPGGKASDPNGLREDHWAAKDNKMIASYYGFMDHYAGNPGRGSGSRRGKAFPLPPVFPSMVASPTQTFDFAHGNVRHSMMGLGGTTGGRQSVHGKTPRFGPQAHHGSPMHSVLLDPHNQPSSVHHGHRAVTSPRQAPQSGTARYRSRQPLVSDPDETAEEDIQARYLNANSRILEEDSMLGDSWRTNRAADPDDETDEARATKAEDPGVLGMLLNFQKAHAEGRGVGI